MPSPAVEILGAGPLTNTGLGFGSNIGGKAANIARALELLEERGIVRLIAVSSIYRTAPWGYVEQDFFANACAMGETRLRPLELLAATTAVEIDMGRKPSVRWGPRLIDIDILFHGDAAFAHAQLNLPHKDLFERAFVLVPLAEIAPHLHISGRSIAKAAALLSGEPIEKWDASGGRS
ncbi:MAG: 2-amino-4-hydroxy-6-hydroxymethyldihydropteridine diphosphokinase [Methylocella sp.]